VTTTETEGSLGLTGGRPAEWSPLPDRDSVPRSPLAAAALRAAGGVAVAVVLWLLGHRTPALVLLAVLALVTVASLLLPPVAAALDRATRTVARVAERGLAFVLLSAVHLLVFTPAWLVLRLLRRDPLVPRGRVPGESLWRPVPVRPGRPLYRRQFAYERAVREDGGAPRSRGSRLRAALGVVLLVLIVDLLAGAAIHRWDRPDEAPRVTGRDIKTSPAARGEPWIGELADEIGNGLRVSLRHDPYLGWRMPDFEGQYVHVEGGVRRSYEPASAARADAVDIMFVGGSTTFGTYQRDEHTIPSEVARLAESAGIPVRMTNSGTIAYVNWQEALHMQQLASGGRRPDIVVFYDGANEILSQFYEGLHTEPTYLHEEEASKVLGVGGAPPAATAAGSPLSRLYQSWKDVSAVAWLSRRIRGLPTDPAEPASTVEWPRPASVQRQMADAAGRNAAALYERGVAMARRVGRSYGIRTAFFWQPFGYSKPLVGDEGDPLGTDPAAFRRAYAVARTRLQAPVTDVSDALDAVREPIMYDWVHTNELGAKVVAGALFKRLEPQLRALHRQRRR
jgi:hypothetical protein